MKSKKISIMFAIVMLVVMLFTVNAFADNSVSKVSDEKYNFSFTQQIDSVSAMTFVCGKAKGPYSDTINITMPGEDEAVKYYIYYVQYDVADDSLNISCNFNAKIPNTVLSERIYVAVVSDTGTVFSPEGLVIPGIGSAKTISICDEDGDVLDETIKVDPGTVTRFSALINDEYENSFVSSDLEYTLSGDSSSNIQLKNNVLTVDKKEETCGKTVTVTASVNGISGSVDVKVNTIDFGDSGSSGGGGSSSKRDNGGSVSVPQQMITPVIIPEYENPFTDIDKSHWAYDSIVNLATLEIVNGGNDGRVNPDDNITREQICAILARHFKSNPSVDTLELIKADASVSEWAKENVAAMVNNGIVQYDEVYKTVNGNLNATREQALVMLARAFGISSQDTAVPFSDVALISDWAMDSVKGLYANGLVSGYTDGTLNPKGNITRAEFFTMIDRLISK